MYEIKIDPTEHYKRNVGPIECEELDECETDIQNIGWTLGNDCPYRCNHCYSLSAREKGKNLSIEIIDRVVQQVNKIGAKTVNLGGNEPIFTNGIDPKNSLLPYIIRSLREKDMDVGLTTSGISALYLEKNHNEEFGMLNDIDISLDSPYEDEHNENRGKNIYHMAIQTLEKCKEYKIDCTIIMCAMNWNFTEERVKELVKIAKKYGANVRINPIKPTEPKHMENALSIEQYYEGFSSLMSLCENVDLTEPPLAAITNFSGSKRCPCGRKSFRIHSITPDGKIPISPCVYLHDYKIGNLLEDELDDLIKTPQFQTFRRRNAHPEAIPECKDCKFLQTCGGGCASRAYLYNVHTTGKRSLFVKDPFCPKDIEMNFAGRFSQNPKMLENIHLVHRDYLCTWIGRPR